MAPTIAYGDAVGNDILAIQDILVQQGYQTATYAENIDTRIKSSKVLHYSKMPELAGEDILIYHFSTGTKLNEILQNYPCRKVMIYHNVTPPHFFLKYCISSYELCKSGVEQLAALKNTFDYCLADSEYNRQDLLRLHYSCPIDVLPILIPFEDYAKDYNKNIVREYRDHKINLMFLGRIAPNKKQEDVIATFYHYKKYYNKDSRLLLVGSWSGLESYYESLERYVHTLSLRDVIFTGHVKFADILAYYRVADVFVSMSEHEGFCVPLVEAMYFDIPIVAYGSSAITSTLGGTGFILKDKDPLLAAGIINTLITDEKLRENIVHKQKQHLKVYQYEQVKSQFLTYLSKFMEA
jgi:glycosyltransferase involved in cell wall biosynthesis